jgi:hypothetical protein
VTENQPARPPAPGASGAGIAIARHGYLVVIHLRHHEWKDGQPREYDDFWVGQVTSVTRAGLVRLYRPAGTFAWDTDGRGRPNRGQPLPSLWFEWAAIKSQKEVDVAGALATAACHTWEGHEGHVRGYDTLKEIRAALRPHLLDQPGWERLRDAAAAWEAAWREARPLPSAAVRAHGAEFRRLSGIYDAAVTAANNTYREQHEQAARSAAA